ncbi:MAG: tetratricopeptide repeat protein [Burkholderiales bacterium]|jgi:TPR repeat protein
MKLEMKWMKVSSVILVIATLLGCSNTNDSSTDSAKSEYDRGRYVEAFGLYRRAAQSTKDPIAAFQVAVMYDSGQGVEKNSTEAVSWYREAIQRGSAGAARNLGNKYLDGNGVIKDFEQAAHYYQRAGELGDANSFYFLGQLFWDLNSDKRDAKRAMGLYAMAAKAGHAEAHNALAVGYQFGEGVAKDDATAFAYFKRSAELGSDAGRINIAKFERGVSEDVRAAGEKILLALRQPKK